MPQQINLLDTSLQRRPERLGGTAVLAGIGATLAVSLALTAGLKTTSAQAAAESEASEHELAALQARAATAVQARSSPETVELARLRAVETGQQRIRAALASGLAGGTQGYSDYLLALSRQTSAQLWITGFSVAADSHSLEIGGRMTDPRQLPDYLKRLDGEPLFKGREFAQLNLHALDPAAGTNAGAEPGYTEFVLRAAAGTSEPR